MAGEAPSAQESIRPVALVAEGLDEIRIDGIRLECQIGLSAHEQDVLQPVDLDVVLSIRPDGLGEGAAERPAVDYKDLKDRLRAGFLGRRFRLLEALAEEAAAVCLAHDRVEKARITAHKPGALTGARGVAVRLTRRHA